MGRAVTASTRRELLTSADLVYEVWRAMHGDIYEEHITGFGRRTFSSSHRYLTTAQVLPYH